MRHLMEVLASGRSEGKRSERIDRFAYAHFPSLAIVGDAVYGRHGGTGGLGRQFLHAWRLAVRLPHGGERTFTVPRSSDPVAYVGTLGPPVSFDPPAQAVLRK